MSGFWMFKILRFLIHTQNLFLAPMEVCIKLEGFRRSQNRLSNSNMKNFFCIIHTMCFMKRVLPCFFLSSTVLWDIMRESTQEGHSTLHPSNKTSPEQLARELFWLEEDKIPSTRCPHTVKEEHHSRPTGTPEFTLKGLKHPH